MPPLWVPGKNRGSSSLSSSPLSSNVASGNTPAGPGQQVGHAVMPANTRAGAPPAYRPGNTPAVHHQPVQMQRQNGCANAAAGHPPVYRPATNMAYSHGGTGMLAPNRAQFNQAAKREMTSGAKPGAPQIYRPGSIPVQTRIRPSAQPSYRPVNFRASATLPLPPAVGRHNVASRNSLPMQSVATPPACPASSKAPVAQLRSISPSMRAGSQPLKSSSTIQRVQSFTEFQLTDTGEKSTQGERYFNTVLKPAYRLVFRHLEGKDPKGTDKSKDLQEGTIPYYKALIAAHGKGLYPVSALNECARLLHPVESEITRRTQSQLTFRNSQMGVLPYEVVHRIASFLGIADQAVLRRVCRYLEIIISRRTILKVDEYGTARRITFNDVIDYMRPYRQMGLHGSSSTHRLSIYRGIRLPEESEKVYTTSQLGRGFYLTQGKGGSSWNYARSVAEESVKTHKGNRYLYRIFMKDTDRLTSQEVPKEHWADMEKDTIPKSLTPYIENYDYLTAPVVKVEHVRQIKVNPRALEHVIALPPLNSENVVDDQSILEWLRALVKEHKL